MIALVWAVWFWKDVLVHLAVGVVYLAVGVGIAVLIPSVLFLPLYVWFLVREKSFVWAFSETWSALKKIFVSILEHVF